MSEFFFFYGTLRHEALLSAVAGRKLAPQRAVLPRMRLVEARDGTRELAFPIPVPGPDGLEGVMVALSTKERARLDYYEAGFQRDRAQVLSNGQPTDVWLYRPAPGRWQQGAPWEFAHWQARWGAIAVAAAQEFMRGFGSVPADRALARYPQMLVRAASRLRAEAMPAPAALRRETQPEDIVIEAETVGYAHFFAVEDYRLRHRTFAGAETAPLDRAVFVSGDAACVLPYDPVRDRVLLIEQFRPGPMARGDRNPWMLEPIAGRVDPFETPEEAVRREAVEEAGLSVGRLIAAPNYYPTPGAKSEFIYNFIALTELPDGVGRPGGMVDEGEDIRPHLASFAQLEELLASGELLNGPAVLLTLWLARLRPELRAAAGA